MPNKIFLLFLLFFSVSCDYIGMFPTTYDKDTMPVTDTMAYAADTVSGIVDSLFVYDSVERTGSFKTDSGATAALRASTSIDTKNVQPDELVNFSEKLLGSPYKYASADPAQGFDCSGFITYVFNKFNIAVPRSSIDFTHIGTEVSAAQAQKGDLILFTGTDSDTSYITRTVGHMGIVTENTDSLRFIHASSGKANGVIITPLNEYYLRRFVKIIRVFPR